MADESPNSYRLLQVLASDRTFLCSDPSDNVVVLKRLDDDCLHRNQLHPSIRDRLARVRELPHPRLAALRTVERWNGNVCLVWIYLDGETWEEAIAKPDADVSALADALNAAVQSLHELGIVHGNLHERNIIIRPDGQLWLTDVSPYLYADPAVDLAAIDDLLQGRLPKEESAPLPEVRGEVAYRWITLIEALICGMVGIGIWLTFHWMMSQRVATSPTTFPSLRH